MSVGVVPQATFDKMTSFDQVMAIIAGSGSGVVSRR